jgi:DNA-binding LytR/AlgR family response regulator
MTEMATGASPNAGPMTQHRAGFVVATIAAVFMTISEAMGTGVVPFWTRLLYWVIVMETGAVIGVGVTTGVQAWGRLHRQPVVEVLVIAVLIAFPLTLGVIGAGMILLGMDRPEVGDMVRNFLLVAFVSAIITGITYAIGSRRKAIIALATVDDARVTVVPDMTVANDNRFRVRLPPHLQNGRILALVSEDHYLRVYTDSGNVMILMRLSDAIAELGGERGAQTHRSWWVSRDAVSKAVRVDGKAILTLSDGTEAPVSRTYYRALSGQGWFS